MNSMIPNPNSKKSSSLYPISDDLTSVVVGDGANLNSFSAPGVLAVAHIQGLADIYYYSTTFSAYSSPVLVYTFQSLLTVFVQVADPSGAFSAPPEKCHPPGAGGHGRCVTDSTMLLSLPSKDSLNTNHMNIPIPRSHYNTHAMHSGLSTPPDSSPISGKSAGPMTIPQFPIRGSSATATPLATPPTTPPSSFSSSPIATTMADAPGLISLLFPDHAHEASKQATGVTIESYEPDGSRTWWDGFILTDSNGGKTLYMNAQNALTEQDRVRGCIVALLDLAGEHLECDAVMMVLEKPGANADADAQEAFGGLVHSLLYVGGVVVTRPSYKIDEHYVLVGIEV